MEYIYNPKVYEELGRFGLRPRATTPPALAKEFVNDLYRHELRRLRARLRVQEIPKEGYSDRVVELRRKYFLLSIRVDFWAKTREPSSPEAWVRSPDAD